MGMTGECAPRHTVVRDRMDLSSVLGGAGDRTGLVAVVGGDAEEWLESFGHLVRTANSVGIVSLGESVRSTTVETGGDTPLPQLSGIADPGDVGALGKTVAHHVSTYRSQGLTPVVLVDAVDELVDAAGLEVAFRVLHLLSAHANAAGGRLVTVLPETMDRQAADTLAALAD